MPTDSGGVARRSSPPIMSLDLSPAWIPCDKDLSSFALLQEVLEDKLMPNPVDDKPWARETLDGELSQASEGQEALWQSVLWLWRIDYLVPELKGADAGLRMLWQRYTSRWLVSRRVAIFAESGF
jgi:hypothetical protein